MQRVKDVVHAKQVYRDGYTGKGIRIALLDTGVYAHSFLKDRIVFFRDYINKRENTYDDNGHGTHIAGILCGGNVRGKNPIGMAPKAELLVFKILDSKGNGSTDKALKALDWILENHRKWEIRILNFSMGYLPNANPDLQEKLIGKLERLWDEGVVVVTAAGNNGPKEGTITVPGISRKIITVGSSDDLDSGSRSGYGGRGPTACCIVKPEILAPGTDVWSIFNKENQMEKKSGTSMSVPIVCGGIALAIEKKKDLTPVEIKLLLYDSVEQMNHKKSKAWGILNVDNLMKML